MLIFLATLSVGAALLYPAWSVRDFRARIETAIEDVDVLANAARDFLDSDSRWPTAAAPGEAPPELASLGGAAGVFDRQGYTLGWTSWQVVDSVMAPPPADIPSADDAPQEDVPPPMLPVVRTVGAITVHAAEPELLAELVDHYSDDTSFVLDSMWLLVLPERAEPRGSGAFRFGR